MRPLRVLITAGPTHEPIDRVRYLANRSSGRVGIEIAEAALDAGWEVVLALGPTHLQPRTTPLPDTDPVAASDSHERTSRFHLIRFTTTAELQRCLDEQAPNADILIMAAAVADYRPNAQSANEKSEKMRRAEGGMSLELESTPDLVAGCARNRSELWGGFPRLIVGFALEPATGLLQVAGTKLKRKGIDLIVANPLETMDASDIEATIVGPGGEIASTDGKIGKQAFARWLVRLLQERVAQ